jgi:hypothetical protein
MMKDRTLTQGEAYRNFSWLQQFYPALRNPPNRKSRREEWEEQPLEYLHLQTFLIYSGSTFRTACDVEGISLYNAVFSIMARGFVPCFALNREGKRIGLLTKQSWVYIPEPTRIKVVENFHFRELAYLFFFAGEKGAPTRLLIRIMQIQTLPS